MKVNYQRFKQREFLRDSTTYIIIIFLLFEDNERRSVKYTAKNLQLCQFKTE